MATCFVPTEEIRKLTRNSFEDMTSRLTAFLEKERSKVFGEGISPRLLGTFSDSVIVGSGDGKFAKVFYEAASDGTFRLKNVEVLTVPLYSDDNLDEYVDKEAKEIAESILEGKGDLAFPKMLGLVSFVGAFPKKTDAQIVEGIIESLKSDRPWKVLFKEKQDTINTLVGEHLESLQKGRLEPKFRALVSGSIPVEKHESYRDLVGASFKELAGRVSSLIESAETAASSVGLARERLKPEDSQQLVATFKAFSEDLLADLRYVKKVVTETINGLSSVANLGCLYDMVAEELIHYEVASRFVVTMAGKLC